MLMNFLSKLEKVHRATTELERGAIYKFRYDIYAKEFGYDAKDDGTDHVNHRIHDENDDAESTIHLDMGGKANINKSMQLQYTTYLVAASPPLR